MNKKLIKIAGLTAVGYLLFALILYPTFSSGPQPRVMPLHGPLGVRNQKLYVDQRQQDGLLWTIYTTLWSTTTPDYKKLVKDNQNSTDAAKLRIVTIEGGPNGIQHQYEPLYVNQWRNSLFPWVYTTDWASTTPGYDKLVKMNQDAEAAVNKNSADALKKLIGLPVQPSK